MTGVDALRLHMPLPVDCEPVVDSRTLTRFAPGTILVNAARAGLVEAPALIAALEDGRVASYHVDVFDTEPPAPSPLMSHSRVIATSHIDGFTSGAVTRATEAAVAGPLEVLHGTAP